MTQGQYYFTSHIHETSKKASKYVGPIVLY